MRVAVVGAAGQLGSDLVAVLQSRAIPLHHAAAGGPPGIDITSLESVAAALDAHAPDAVVNAAAYNLVDDAERDPETAFRVNAFGPRHLALACAQRGIPLLHVSTDYVFGLDAGRTKPWSESDLPGPVNVYGASKLAGEHLVRIASPRHFIVRTCGLYGRAAGTKGNFVRTVRRLAARRDELRIVHDQRCTPTSTADLAPALVRLLETQVWGTYHVTNGGDCTWYEFASAVVAELGLATRVVPVATSEFPRPARRPAYSVLDGSKFARTTHAPLRPWRDALADYLAHSDA
jgi:dTDP-4-dehydrorhamnose reductase